MARPVGKKTVGIYAIRFLPTGHCYVGSGLHVEARLRHHRQRLEDGKSHNKVLQFAWDLFSLEDFAFELLEECPREKLQERERFYLSSTSRLFNILKDGRRPGPLSDSAKKKLSERAKQQHKQGNLGRATWRR